MQHATCRDLYIAALRFLPCCQTSAQPERKSEMITRANGGRTVPQIFIGDTHVGGCDDLYALERAGKLDALLAA